MPRFVRFCCLAEKFAACQTHRTILCGKKVRPCRRERTARCSSSARSSGGVQVYGSYRFAVASRRGGTLYCTQAGDRIRMSGNAAVHSVADIRID